MDNSKPFAVLTFAAPTCYTPETTEGFITRSEATARSNELAKEFVCAEVRDVVGGCMISRNYPNPWSRADAKALELWQAKDPAFIKHRRSHY